MLMLFGAIIFGFSVLGIAGIVNFGTDWGPYVLLICPILISAVYLLIAYEKYAKPWDKHLILSAIVVFSGLVHFLYPLSSMFLVFGPILISIKYYDKRLTTGVAIMTLAMYSATFAANLLLERYSDLFSEFHARQAATIWAYPIEAFSSRFIPHVCMILLAWFISCVISVSGRKMVISQVEMSTRQSKYEAELSAASDLQFDSMPSVMFTSENGAVSIDAFLQPAKEVGGDFYDYFMIDENLLAVVIADVSDKGMPAALFMMRAQSTLRYALNRDRENSSGIDLARAMTMVNRHLVKNNPKGMFVTMWVGCIDCRTGMGKYVNAGHLPPILRHSDGSVDEISSDPQLFIGAFEDRKYSTGILKLSAGDTLVVCTDGVPDSRDSDDHTFGDERLLDVVRSVKIDRGDRISKKILDGIVDQVMAFSDNEHQFDDITVMTVHFDHQSAVKIVEMNVSGDEFGTKTAIDRLNELLVETDCPENVRQNLSVVVDEICANICEYAYEDRNGTIGVRYEAGVNFITMQFTDDGDAFDPLAVDLPDFDGEPKIGGIGIYLVKNLTDWMKYEYVNGKNCLKIMRIWNA